MLKIEDLEVGDELVCVDRDGFLTERRNAGYLLHNEMIISNINEHEIYLRCDNDEKSCRNYIYVHELKYFKKKEQLLEYNDLIDVAVQAKKDSVIGATLVIYTDYIDFDYNGTRYLYKQGFYEDGINFIKSLYKETFVIETEEDLGGIDRGAKVTLKNGEVIFLGEISADGNWFEFNDGNSSTFPFIALKGATVEQERGRDE